MPVACSHARSAVPSRRIERRRGAAPVLIISGSCHLAGTPWRLLTVFFLVAKLKDCEEWNLGPKLVFGHGLIYCEHLTKQGSRLCPAHSGNATAYPALDIFRGNCPILRAQALRKPSSYKPCSIGSSCLHWPGSQKKKDLTWHHHAASKLGRHTSFVASLSGMFS